MKKQKAERLARRGYYTLTSPFTGILAKRMADVGDLASPSKNLFEVHDRSMSKIVFDVPQKDLPRLKKGQTVTFRIDDQIRKGEIQLLEPAINQAKMMRAEVWLDGESADALTPGAYVSLKVNMERLKNIILIPASALIEGPEGATYVFAVREGKLAATSVRVLGRSADRLAVRGVEAGTRVVANTYLGWATLSSGQKVEVVR